MSEPNGFFVKRGRQFYSESEDVLVSGQIRGYWTNNPEYAKAFLTREAADLVVHYRKGSQVEPAFLWWLDTVREHVAAEKRAGRTWSPTSGCACDPCRAARKARFMHDVCVCGRPKALHTDGEDGDRVNALTSRGTITLCQGYQELKVPA